MPRTITPRYQVAPRDPEPYFAAVDRYAVLSARWRAASRAQLVALGVGTGTAPPPRLPPWLIDAGMLAVWTIIILFAFTWPLLVIGWLLYAALEVALLRWRW